MCFICFSAALRETVRLISVAGQPVTKTLKGVCFSHQQEVTWARKTRAPLVERAFPRARLWPRWLAEVNVSHFERNARPVSPGREDGCFGREQGNEVVRQASSAAAVPSVQLENQVPAVIEEFTWKSSHVCVQLVNVRRPQGRIRAYFSFKVVTTRCPGH